MGGVATVSVKIDSVRRHRLQAFKEEKEKYWRKMSNLKHLEKESIEVTILAVSAVPADGSLQLRLFPLFYF